MNIKFSTKYNTQIAVDTSHLCDGYFCPYIISGGFKLSNTHEGFFEKLIIRGKMVGWIILFHFEIYDIELNFFNDFVYLEINDFNDFCEKYSCSLRNYDKMIDDLIKESNNHDFNKLFQYVLSKQLNEIYNKIFSYNKINEVFDWGL